MAYLPLPIPGHVTERVESVIRECIDPRLSDVHAMLRLPLPSLGIPQACNFAIADVLLGVIGGVSSVLHPRLGDQGPSFKSCIKDHYLIDDEPASGIPIEAVAKVLWVRVRNPGQHVLGLAIGKDLKTRKRVPLPEGQPVIVHRDKDGMSEDQLAALESAANFPTNLLSCPTLMRSMVGWQLTVEPLYYGTRRLICHILANKRQMRQAEEFLREMFWHPSDEPIDPSLLPRGTTQHIQHTHSSVTVPSVTSGTFHDLWEDRVDDELDAGEGTDNPGSA